jgi:phosphoenolpyruvate carboxykinase (GTP)
MRTITHDTLFTNVALTPDKDVWWEGMGIDPPAGLISWLGEPWDPKSGKPAAHPNSRFTVSAKQSPIYDPKAEDPKGVPISAILFGGRRNSVVPLVYESFSWQHGVFLGASTSSEMTVAAKGEIGKLRHDSFSMLPFCGYNMGDYFAHWLEMGKKSLKPPRIYYVNWFLKSAKGEYLWPGYGENCRILKWIFERISNQAPAEKTPIGYIPETLDLTGLNVDLKSLFRIDPVLWLQETEDLTDYFKLFGSRMPKPLLEELAQLKQRLRQSSATL